MFEISYNDQDALEYYVGEKMAYKNAEYDFTFEKRYIVYHATLRRKIVYFAIDMQTKLSTEVCSRNDGTYFKHEYMKLIPDILYATKYDEGKSFTGFTAENLLETIDFIFRVVFPEYGYTIREEQINLCKKMFKGLTTKSVAICEAEVGTGKSLAYLIAAVCAKLYMKGNCLANQPITITTSNIELQNALIEKEIPRISEILTEYHIIDKPLRAVLRKGKEHYFCRFRYEDYVEKIKRNPEKYNELLSYLETSKFCDKAFDLDKIKISGSFKSKVCVKGNCGKCQYWQECKYAKYISYATGYERLDFQVTNHNLYLTATKNPCILRDTSLVIVDEAHKLKEAARDIYGERIAENDIDRYLNWVKILCKNKSNLSAFKKLHGEVTMLKRILFDKLRIQAKECDNECGCSSIISLPLGIICIIKELSEDLDKLDAMRKIYNGRCEVNAKLIAKSLLHFTQVSKVSVWIEIDENNMISLCCSPKNVGANLMQDLWNCNRRHVLTSGTMSDGKSFSFFKRENGLDRIAAYKILEVSTPSPFDYSNHARLYIPDDMPFPDNDSEKYIQIMAERIVKLISASNGHTAILFTSYKMLHSIYEITKDKLAEFDVICMTRSNKTAIADFKKSKNGVLFAAGSMWEGVDCVGDCLSSVIIVRLPFPLRSATMEEKKSACGNVPKFIQEYAVPEMLIKLRQGAGRLIRSESDTGLLSILDARASKDGKYREQVLNALRKYPLVESVDEAMEFFKMVKSPEYFEKGESAYDN